MIVLKLMDTTKKSLEEPSAKPVDFFQTRRQFLQRAGMGFGALSLATLLGEDLFLGTHVRCAVAWSLLPQLPHFAAKATHVVHIFAQGAPSQVDTWDPKPALVKYDGTSIPNMDGIAMASPFKFEKKGRSG